MRRCGLRCGVLLLAGAVLLVCCAQPAAAKDRKQAAFERVFGKAARLDLALVAKVKKLPAGKRLWVAGDGNGRKDEVWFMDTDKRHTIQPILVRVMDEDADFAKDGGPDLDNDLYVADWDGDGRVDAVVDYQDNDGDGQADEMGIYFWRGSAEKGDLHVWWLRNQGGRFPLLYDVNWSYVQTLCQHRCYLSGDQTLVSFHLPEGSDRWIGYFENPFLFFDPDGDRCSEIALRFTGTQNRLESLRYSFDADNDSHGRWVYDYDFSISAWAERLHGPKMRSGLSKATFGREQSFTTVLRGIPTTEILRRDAAQQVARTAPWARACLTWDEMNANTDADVQRDPAPRWEGVLDGGVKDFPQVGGPGCSRFNRRYELMRPARPLQLYCDAVDRRIHLLGNGPADGWIDVDYDLDGKIDAKYVYVDEDKDGVFERRQIDLDADGRPEFDWLIRAADRLPVPLEYGAIVPLYRRLLAETLEESQTFIDAARGALEQGRGRSSGASGADAIETFFLTRLESWQPVEGLGRRVRGTPEGARYYVDLVRDRLLWELKKRFGGRAAWPEVERAYAAGKYSKAAELVLGRLAPGAKAARTACFGTFTRRIPVVIDNTDGPWRDNWPVVLSVKDLQTAAADFNADNCAVVAPDRWLDWREIPHQVDCASGSAGQELSFLAQISPGVKAAWYVYYSPGGKRDKSFARRTSASADWDSEKLNIGWESSVAAYRTYNGQIDFFGKHTYDHSQKVEWLIYPTEVAKKANYHHELPWGIDALHVNDTPGLGGLSLALDKGVWPAHNSARDGHVKFSKRIVAAGPVRAMVEVTARNVVPARPDLAVRVRHTIYAEHQESEVCVDVGGGPRGMLMTPCLVKLKREQTFVDRRLGCVGSWGRQDEKIGEIGLGVIVPPERLKDVVESADHRQLRCDGSAGKLRYWIIGDWRRSRRFPVGPTILDWRDELRDLAAQLHRPTGVLLGAVETLP
jgi:hypothetical protein